MDKRFWIILVAIAVVVVGIIWFSGSGKSNAPGGSGQPTSHIEGKGKTGVKLVEYGDYQCPFCGQYFPVVKQVAATYNNDIFFQFRNLPLTQLHQNALAGARAAEAAALQGKFWQMHDLLYENQAAWSSASDPESVFVQYAAQLGLNVTKFKADFESDQVNNSINADVAAFQKTGQQEGTPTFFLDGKVIAPGVFNTNEIINGPATLANFEKEINAAIKAKGFKPPAGTSTTGSSSTSSGSTQSKQ